jgi:hypothetical protein
MSCCGNQRAQLHAMSPPEPRPAYPDVPLSTPPAPARRFIICFEYTGQTGLTVLGGATGQRYRFDRPGARVVVDPRDRPSLAAVPNLRLV